jgi:hypothetical protein
MIGMKFQRTSCFINLIGRWLEHLEAMDIHFDFVPIAVRPSFLIGYRVELKQMRKAPNEMSLQRTITLVWSCSQCPLSLPLSKISSVMSVSWVTSPSRVSASGLDEGSGSEDWRLEHDGVRVDDRSRSDAFGNCLLSSPSCDGSLGVLSRTGGLGSWREFPESWFVLESFRSFNSLMEALGLGDTGDLTLR